MKLYKALLILSALFVGSMLPLYAHAQIGEPRNQLSIGVNGGMVFNTMSFDPTIKQLSHKGKSFGVTLRYICEKYFTTVCAVQAEINYTQLGWEEDIMNASGQPLPDTYQRNMDYLQLPLLARLSWGKEKGGLMFFILLGPQLGYCMNETDKRSSEWTLAESGQPDRPNNVCQQYDLKIQNKLDYGLLGGLGLEFNTRKGQHFMLDGRYYYGLSDVFKNGKKDPFSRSSHSSICAKFTYLFNLFDE